MSLEQVMDLLASYIETTASFTRC